MQHSKPKVIIVGGGFGGLRAAKELNGQGFNITLIDRNNHHVFQPLLYQVATSALSPGDIATPIRTELRRYKDVEILRANVESIMAEERKIQTSIGILDYDYLVLATGNRHSYFGKPHWESNAPGLKNLFDALTIREKILTSFDYAERTYGTDQYNKYTTFVIVGGGPTGVELAGSISEIASKTMLADFPLLRHKDVKIILCDGSDRILNSFSTKSSQYAKKVLTTMGVEIRSNCIVQEIFDDKVVTNLGEITTANVIWAAGNSASPLLQSIGTKLDNSGRAIVKPDLSVQNYDNIFVIGDSACFLEQNGKSLPGVAQVAMQMGNYVAKRITNDKHNNTIPAFKYNDKGSMATIGRAKAVAEFFDGKVKINGLIAWLLWGMIHILFLIDFRNRIKVLLEWFWYYITFRPGAGLILRDEAYLKSPKKT